MGLLSHTMNDRRALTKTIINILRPLARLMIRYEIAHGEFVELAKVAYTQAAKRYFQISNKKMTHSRIAVLTGLSRKEAVRLADLGEDELASTRGALNRAVQVINGWLNDKDFLDGEAQPRVLPMRGSGGSFEELVARYSGDITARTILDELVRVGAVTKVAMNSVKLESHGYVPQNNASEKMTLAAQHTADLLDTTAHNILCRPKDARFQRQVAYHDVPQSVIDEFQQYSYEKSLALLLDFDRWLAEKKKLGGASTNEPTGRVGTGIYFFQNDND